MTASVRERGSLHLNPESSRDDPFEPPVRDGNLPLNLHNFSIFYGNMGYMSVKD